MSTDLAATFSPDLKSWITSANDGKTDFPIQNLPLGVFSRGNDAEHRIGIAIGDEIIDLKAAQEIGLLNALSPQLHCALHAETLNDLMKQGRAASQSLRIAVSNLLDENTAILRDDESARTAVMVSQHDATMHLPATIGDYTDFYASVHHATNIGSMFRPDNPLLPNYKNLPVGYHGRASSINISGAQVRRPCGQLKPSDTEPPIFAPCRLLDYEMEMGVFVGPRNQLGERITIDKAPEHLFGMVIVNDWSARDVQKWEYQPLGPFNAKNFATTISPWVVTMEALSPFRLPGPHREQDDPPTLDYLRAPTGDDHHSTYDITVEVSIRSSVMREKNMEATKISRGSFKHMYWTIAQMLTHHSSTGCNMQPGDLLASGTISGPEEDSRGCLLERTWRGEHPIKLADGTERKFLQDGDEVIMTAYCEKNGAKRIGFGQCRGTITHATH